METRRDPGSVDPSNQSGRPVLVTGAILAILLVLAVMVGVYFLAR